MGVEDRDVLDMVSVEEASGTLCLTMVEPREWRDDSVRAVELQDKLNQYLHYLASEQLRRDYPDASERRRRIELLCRFPPPRSFWPILQRVHRQLERLELGFRVLLLGDDERSPEPFVYSDAAGSLGE